MRPQLVKKEEALSPLAAAEADLADAQAAFFAAKELVQAAIAKWPPGSQDRRVIAAMGTPALAVDYTSSDQQREFASRIEAYRKAIETEERTKRTLEKARDTLDRLQAEARDEALGDGRAALRYAIDDAAATKKALAAAEAASSWADELVFEARRRFEAAEEALSGAGIAASLHMEKMARGEIFESPTIMREARAAEQDARDDLEAARAARDRLKQSAPETNALRIAERRIEEAIGFVLSKDKNIAEYVSETRELLSQINERMSVLRVLARHLPNGPAKEAISSLQATSINPSEPEKHPGVAPWLAAIDALKRDADAHLPKSGDTK